MFIRQDFKFCNILEVWNVLYALLLTLCCYEVVRC